jgi:hypothetical protein
VYRTDRRILELHAIPVVNENIIFLLRKKFLIDNSLAKKSFEGPLKLEEGGENFVKVQHHVSQPKSIEPRHFQGNLIWGDGQFNAFAWLYIVALFNQISVILSKMFN